MFSKVVQRSTKLKKLLQRQHAIASKKLSTRQSKQLKPLNKHELCLASMRKKLYNTQSVDPRVGRLENKTAIVTGAGGRLGRSVCELFRNEGATVIAIDKNEERLNRVKNDYKCETYLADCSNEDEVASYVTHIFKKHHKIDVLVNNTRMKGDVKSFHTTKMDTFDTILKTNLICSMLNCKHVLPYMVTNRHGSIVNIGTFLYSTMALSGLSSYVIAKHGILGLTKSVAQEYAKHGIRCNTVSPGPTIDTRIIEGAAQYASDLLGIPKNEILQKAAENGKLYANDHRLADVHEVAETILFLATDESLFVNSVNIDVDGGLRYRSTV